MNSGTSIGSPAGVLRDPQASPGLLPALAIGLLLFWVYGDRPLVGEPWQWADDGLYLRQAEAIVRWLHGDAPQWLGPYDAVLLSKTPLFAIWLALLYVLRLPLHLAEFAALVAVPVIFAAAVRPVLVLSRWQMVGALLMLTPLPFLPHEQRLLRNALQAALASGCLIAAVGVILRMQSRNPAMVRWAAATGVFYAFCYLNREESVWLTPVLAAAVTALVVQARLRRSWRLGLVTCTILLAGIAIPIAMVTALNYRAYGAIYTTVRRAPAFTRAYQLMTRLDPESRQRFVPISSSARLQAYAVSPTFARLRDYLEGPATDAIARHPGHLFLNQRPAGTREFFVSNFEFVLRDAAFHTGASTAAAAEALFAQIADELEDAIAAGRIGAGSRGPALLAAPLPGDYRRIVEQTFVSLYKLYTFESLSLPADGISSGSIEDLQRLENMTQTASAPTGDLKRLDLPDLGSGARRAIYRLVTAFQLLAYAAGTITLLVLGGGWVVRNRRTAGRGTQAFAGLVLCSALFTFSLSMGVVHVLGFPLLQWAVAYNTLGYAPLAVVGAFGLVILRAAFGSHSGVMEVAV